MAALLHDAQLALHPPGYTLTGWKIRGLPTRHPGKSFRFRVAVRRSTANAAADKWGVFVVQQFATMTCHHDNTGENLRASLLWSLSLHGRVKGM